MKNITPSLLIVVCVAIFFSCSSSDDDTNSRFFNPPNWIQGTWLHIDNDVIVGGYQFTSDNFISILGDNQLRTNFKELLEIQANAGGNTNVIETITDNEYSFTIDQEVQSQSFSFYKVSENEIESTDGIVTYTKQL